MNESRKDKSLYTLTKKFVEMLKTEETVDLNNVTNELNCAKKRRIYDVSNVLEGIGLIKKTQKNLYQYTGKTYKDQDNLSDQTRLKKVKDEKQLLETEEKELDKDITNLKMNFEALATHSSYTYITRKDLIDAFGKDSLLTLVKDCRNINFLFEESKSIPLVHFIGSVVKPVTVKLVNTENPVKNLPKTFSENRKDSDGNSTDDNNEPNIDPRLFNSHKKLKKSDNMILFRRSFKSRSFLQMDPKENESLAANILSHDRFEGKSKFYYVNKNQLVLTNDYTQPDFISIDPPIDFDYSTDSPSVHDLFDINIEPLNKLDDEFMEEEYIVEELDEDAYETLQ